MKIGNIYYYITDKGTVGKSTWFNSKKDQYRLMKANVFKIFRKIKPIADKINH